MVSKLAHTNYSEEHNVAVQGGIDLFKVNNGKARTMCEICSKFTIKPLERRLYTFSKQVSGVSIVDSRQVS